MKVRRREIDSQARRLIRSDREQRTKRFTFGGREKDLPPVTLAKLKFMDGPGPEAILGGERPAAVTRKGGGPPAGQQTEQLAAPNGQSRNFSCV